jgi:hypothetical protein
MLCIPNQMSQPILSQLAEGGKVGITELVDTVGRGAGEQNESASG